MSSSSSFFVLTVVLSLSSLFFSQSSAQKFPVPEGRVGPEAFAFDKTGEGFYTGVSGGRILKYNSNLSFVDFAQTSEFAKDSSCDGALDEAQALKCGRPAGIAFNEKTGDLYIADAPLGLYVVSSAGGLATKIADSVDGKPFKFLDGLDVDPTTGDVYFTSFSSNFVPSDVLKAVAAKDASGKLFKYDQETKKVEVLVEGLAGPAGCAVSSVGSFVLVGEFIKSTVQKYWIKGPKAGEVEQITDKITFPDNIKRIDSSGNFWVASVLFTKEGKPTNPSGVKISSDGEVLQSVPLTDSVGETLVSEVNEFNESLHLGTLFSPLGAIKKL